MNVLDGPSLLSLAKTSLDEVTSLDLQRGRYENVDVIGNCPLLENVYLSRNNLATFTADARRLWKIDLSHNALTSVGTLANFAALGFLDLSHNDLEVTELANLRGIHIVSLRVAANPKLAAIPHYRASLIFLLPDVWVLDDQFVTWREREAAQLLFSSKGEARDSPLHKLVGNTGDMVWRSSSNGSEHASNLLSSLTQEPIRPALRDRFRLERLLHVFNEQHAREQEFLASSTSVSSGFKGRGRAVDHHKSGAAQEIVGGADLVVGIPSETESVEGSDAANGTDSTASNLLERQRLAAAVFQKWTPATCTNAIGLNRLTPREQIDLVVLLNSIHEFGVPRALAAQALAVHFGASGRLLPNVLHTLTQHPEAVFRANAYHVRFANITARDAAIGVGHTTRRKMTAASGTETDHTVEELWKAIDDREGIETHLQSSSSKPRVGLGLGSLARLRASHAAILLSRAPTFPAPLLRTAQSKVDFQIEKCLEPLFQAARMTADEITFAAASAPAQTQVGDGVGTTASDLASATASRYVLDPVAVARRASELNESSHDTLELLVGPHKYHHPPPSPLVYSQNRDDSDQEDVVKSVDDRLLADGTDIGDSATDNAGDEVEGSFFLTGDGTADEFNAALDDLPVEFFTSDAPQRSRDPLEPLREKPDGSPVQRRIVSPRTLASVKLDPSVAGVGRSQSSQCLYTKQPVMGEQVEIGFLARAGQPHRVVARIKRTDEATLHLLTADKRAAKSFQGGNLRVAKSDVFYDPRGLWRHRSAVSMRALERELSATVPALHRQPTGSSRSGTQHNANVPNATGIPASLVAHHSTHHAVNPDAAKNQAREAATKGRPAKAQAAPAGVTAYTVNSKWDSHFVLAPASVVQAQNTFARLQEHSGVSSAGAAAWSRLNDDHVPSMQLPPGLIGDSRANSQLEHAQRAAAAMAQTPVHVTEPLWQKYGQQRKTFREARHHSKWSDVRDKPVSMLPADFVHHMQAEMQHQFQQRQSPVTTEVEGQDISELDADELSFNTESEVTGHDVPAPRRRYGQPKSMVRSRTTRRASSDSIRSQLQRKHNLLPEVGGIASRRKPESMSVAALSSSLIQAPKSRRKLEKMLRMPASFQGYRPPRLARRKPFGSLGI